MEFQVGHLIHISRQDPTFIDRHAQGRAIEHDVGQRRAESDELMIQPYDVWTDQAHGSELVAIAYGDSVFTPAA